MREGLLALLLLGVAGALAACDPGASTSPSDFAPGQEFTLAPGGAALVDALRVSFERVVEDSRCPKDVVCVWAGQVVIEVKLAGELHQLKAEATVSTGGHRVRLVRVEPYPASASPIPPADYRATLVVDRS